MKRVMRHPVLMYLQVDLREEVEEEVVEEVDVDPQALQALCRKRRRSAVFVVAFTLNTYARKLVARWSL